MFLVNYSAIGQNDKCLFHFYLTNLLKVEKVFNRKKILVLGGTKFIGKNLVEKLQKLPQYHLHLFNRGITNPKIFKNLKHFFGDRNKPNEIQEITNQDWDVIIDLSCYFPESLRNLLSKIKGKVGLYIFVSSIAAYDVEKNRILNEIISEDFPLKNCTKEQEVDDSFNSYGNRKAACEKILLAEGWLKKIILSPCITYGQYNHYQRIYYWLNKIRTQKSIILPDDGKDIATYTFVDDLVHVITKCLLTDIDSNKFNVSTHQPMNLKQIVQVMARSLKEIPSFVNVPSDYLKEQQLVPRRDIPLWNDGNHLALDNTKVTEEMDVNFHSFESSIEKTIQFYVNQNWPDCVTGINSIQEKNILKNSRFILPNEADDVN